MINARLILPKKQKTPGVCPSVKKEKRLTVRIIIYYIEQYGFRIRKQSLLRSNFRIPGNRLCIVAPRWVRGEEPPLDPSHIKRTLN